MLNKIRITVNGKLMEIEINTGETLLEVLRERLHLTGTKEGCGVGECGACTVLVDGTPINSCLYLGVWANGSDILTIEGIANNGKLSAVQQAFVDEGAIQCGFCTPGLVITATAMHTSGRSFTDQEIKQELSGHFCRCTGYQNIFKAVAKSLDSENNNSSSGGE
jgi:aerobic-type carbon monoxide dehydrogenase small subunit (CoxS/CutS family)